MRIGFRNIGRLIWRTYFPGANSPARRSVKRLCVMSAFLPLFVSLQIAHKIGLSLDAVLFPGFRRIAIERPVFMVGVPRSGTTLLHRLLALDTKRFTTITLWEALLAPSLTERAVFAALSRLDRLTGGVGRRLTALIDQRLHAELDAVHPTSLAAAEEDYLAFMPVLACFLLILPFPFYDEFWYLSRFDDEATPAEKAKLMRFYRGIIQRHLYWHGAHKTYLSKNPSFSSLVRTLNAEFPDARFICNLRNPEKVYPSLLNSMTDGARAFDNALQDDVYQQALCDVLEHYYFHLTKAMDELPHERHAYVTMETLVRNPAASVEELKARFGWDTDPTFQSALADAVDESRTFRSRHRYSLDQFHVDPTELRASFAVLYERFDWPVARNEDATDHEARGMAS